MFMVAFCAVGSSGGSRDNSFTASNPNTLNISVAGSVGGAAVGAM